MRRVGLTLVILALGCSGESDSAGDAAAADSAAASDAVAADSAAVKACDLVTAAELASIIGEEFRDGRTTNDYMGVSQCKWDRAAGQGEVTISLHRQGKLENYRRVPGAGPAAGLGDEAVWNPETRQLAFRTGEAVVSISFLFEPAEQAWAEQVGHGALGVLTNEGDAKGQLQVQ